MSREIAKKYTEYDVNVSYMIAYRSDDIEEYENETLTINCKPRSRDGIIEIINQLKRGRRNGKIVILNLIELED